MVDKEVKRIKGVEAVKRFYSRNRVKMIAYRNMYKITSNGRYTTYKASAKRRGIEFVLTLEEFTSIIKQDCSYCGSKDSIGVDRVDNEKGYLFENSSSCCTMCNMMKKNLPVEIFLEHCMKISSFNT